MATLDWIFAVVMLASVLLGAWRGLVYEVLSLMGWLAAFVLARWLASDVAQYLPMSGASEVLRYAVGFLLVFVATVMLSGLLATILKKLMSSVGLRPVDRALGAVFGASRAVMLLLLATMLAGMTPLKDSQAWTESRGVGMAEMVLQGIKPVLPPELDRFLPV